MFTLELLLLHAAAYGGNLSTAERLAAMQLLVDEIDAAQAAPDPGPVDDAPRLASERVDAWLKALKQSDRARFDAIRRKPFAELLALADA